MSRTRPHPVHHALTHAALVPAPADAPTRRSAPAVWVLAAAVSGLAAGWLAPGWLDLRRPTAPDAPHPAELRAAALQGQLEQARAALQVAGARGAELERQVDGVNRQLHASQEELAFFRKARPGVVAQR